MKRLVQIGLILMVFHPHSTSPAAWGMSATSPRPVRRPCSLQRFCQKLSRRFGVNVAPDPSLADLRVVWAFNADTSLEVTLARLAELTGGRVVTRPSVTGKQRLL